MTETKKSPNQIFRLTIILFLVTAVTAAVLGFTNQLTAPIIEAQGNEATFAAYKEVLEADNYESVDYDTAAYPTVTGIHRADDKGYVVELTFSGAQGMISAVVGVDNASTVTGVSIVDQSETAGLGAKAVEPAFRDQYVGVSGHADLTSNGGTIQAITGATITSNAVTGAVNTALDAVASLG